MRRDNVLVLFIVAYLLGGVTMPRGAPDYQTLETQTVRVEQGSVNQSVYDVGFSRLDGGGRVIWFEDFREGLYRNNLGSGGGGVVPNLSFIRPHLYGFSPTAFMDPIQEGGTSSITNMLSLPVSGKIGFEFGFYLPSSHGQLQVSLTVGIVDGVNKVYTLLILEDTNVVQVSSGLGGQTVYTPGNSAYLRDRHVSIKMVVDPSTGRYDELFVGANKIDIGNFSGTNSSPIGAGTVIYTLLVQGRPAPHVEPVYINYFIISADEP